ncbi:hypothetical protein ACFWJT_15780 [Streptomyces sp. NPDC127069]
MDRMEKAEGLREQAEKAYWNGDWERGEALEEYAEYLIYDADDEI